MIRLLVLGALVVLAVWLLRRALRGAGTPERVGEAAGEGELVSCARCGLHLPRGDATGRDGALYCSEEHARLGPGR